MTLRYMVNGLVEGEILKQKDKHMKMMSKKHEQNLILHIKIEAMMTYRMMVMMGMQVVVVMMGMEMAGVMQVVVI